MKDEADMPQTKFRDFAVAERADVAPFDLDGARSWCIDRAQEIEQRRFPTSGRSDDREVLALLDLERDAAQRVHGLALERIITTHIAGPHERRHATASSRSVLASGSDAARHAG